MKLGHSFPNFYLRKKAPVLTQKKKIRKRKKRTTALNKVVSKENTPIILIQENVEPKPCRMCTADVNKVGGKTIKEFGFCRLKYWIMKYIGYTVS